LTYSVRRMVKEDLGQVTEIDREVFSTQWPPTNYRQELENKLAHYIVVFDDTKTVEESQPAPPNGLSKLILTILTIMPWFNRKRPHDSHLPTVKRQYIIGFSGIWVLADEAHITNIAVRQQYQRQGIGELLLISTIDLAKERKADTMTLEVRASNYAAQNLYTKYGFTQVGLRRGYYLDNREDAVLMSTESITSPSFQAKIEQLREALGRKWGNLPVGGGTSPTANPEKI
jgi:ribosomal-protein-alanine N-acetyltransferase